MQKSFYKALLVVFLLLNTSILFACTSRGGVKTPGQSSLENTLTPGATSFMPPSPTSELPSEKDLPLQYATIVEDEKFLYYCLPQGIYKENKQTGNKALIVSVSGAFALELYNGAVFYAQNASDDADDVNIYRVNENDSSSVLIFKGSLIPEEDIGMFTKYTFHNGLLYIQMNMSLYCFYTETNELQLITRYDTNFVFNGNYVYYLDHGERDFTVYRKNLSNLQVELVLGEGILETEINQIRGFAIKNEAIYYTMYLPDSLNCYADGKTTQLVKDEGILGNVIIYGEKIFYFSRGSTSAEPSVCTVKSYNPQSGMVQNEGVVEDWDGYTAKIVNNTLYYANRQGDMQKIAID